MTPNVANLAASIINDQRYSELKNYLYESHGGDHATAVKILSLLQDAATEAKEHGFIEGARLPTETPEPSRFVDEDLDESLTDEEIAKRRK